MFKCLKAVREVCRCGKIRYVSAYVNDTFEIEYGMGSFAKPVVGGILVFEKEEDAFRFTDLTDLKLFRAVSKIGRIIRPPLCLGSIDGLDNEAVRSVWEGKIQGINTWPVGTVAVGDLKLVEEIERRTS